MHRVLCSPRSPFQLSMLAYQHLPISAILKIQLGIYQKTEIHPLGTMNIYTNVVVLVAFISECILFSTVIFTTGYGHIYILDMCLDICATSDFK